MNTAPATREGQLMTTTEPRVQQLRNLIDELVEVISCHGGRMALGEAGQSLARATGLPLSEVSYIVNSAVADHRIISDLRSGILELRTSSDQDAA